MVSDLLCDVFLNSNPAPIYGVKEQNFNACVKKRAVTESSYFHNRLLPQRNSLLNLFSAFFRQRPNAIAV
jgi:hypothetical protein